MQLIDKQKSKGKSQTLKLNPSNHTQEATEQQKEKKRKGCCRRFFSSSK